jgi:hypothetical protein
MRLGIQTKEHTGQGLFNSTAEVHLLFGRVLVSTTPEGSVVVTRKDETDTTRMCVELTPQAISDAVVMGIDPAQLNPGEKLEVLALMMKRLDIRFKTTASIECVDDDDDRQGEANWDVKTSVIVSGKEIEYENETGYHDSDAEVEIEWGADEFRELYKQMSGRRGYGVHKIELNGGYND